VGIRRRGAARRGRAAAACQRHGRAGYRQRQADSGCGHLASPIFTPQPGEGFSEREKIISDLIRLKTTNKNETNLSILLIQARMDLNINTNLKTPSGC
jgi:hypothetical protein